MNEFITLSLLDDENGAGCSYLPHVDNLSTVSSDSNSPQEERIRKTRHRIQYISCDQCRKSKRACGFRHDIPSPTSVCSTCETRGLQCTKSWLEGKAGRVNRRIEQKDKEGGITTTTPTSAKLPSPSQSEGRMAQDLMSNTLAMKKFNIFLYTVEFPLSHWLSDGCIPSSGGLDLIPKPGQAPQSLEIVIKAIHLNVMPKHLDYQSASSFPPRFIYALCALDIFFGQDLHLRGAGNRASSKQRSSLQEQQINNALLYSIIATSSQYGTSQVRSSMQRQLAETMWYKARNAVFSCISAQSFRLTAALIIFGLISPPNLQTDEEKNLLATDPLEESAYALQHGLNRTQALCKRVKALLSSREYSERGFLEGIIGAVEWLCNIVTTVTTLTDMEMAAVLTPDPSITAEMVPNFRSSNSTADVTTSSSSIWNQILTRSQTFRNISTELTITPETPEQFLQMVFRWAASLKVLIWKAVSDFRCTLQAEHISQDHIKDAYQVVMSLTTLWEDCYADYHSTIMRFDFATSSMTQSMQSFSGNHVNLAIIHFINLIDKSLIARKILCNVAVDDYHYRLKVRSAERIALASLLRRPHASLTADAAQDTVPSVEGPGKQLPLGLWCHPYPAMIVQAQFVAGIILLQEAQSLTHRGQDASMRTRQYQACTTSLRELQKTLISFPSHIVHPTQIDRLESGILID